MNEEFHGPDVSKEEDEKLLEEAQPQARVDWSEIYWKPKPKKDDDFENVTRILPGKGKATYHLKIGRHFIKHEDRTEMFFCNLETYGEPCVACEKRAEFLKKGEDKAANFYKPDVRGVFNVVDYADEAKVKLWEAPPVLVWVFILNIVRGKSRYNNVVGTKENALEGRDIVVFYDPDAQPQNMYKIQFEPTSVLKAASAKKWLEEAKELLAEDLYPRTPSEVARIKTFGSVEEREELRKKLAEQAAGPKEEATEEAVEGAKEDDEVAKAKKVLADAEAKKAEKEKEKEKEPEEDEVAKAERILAEAKKKKADEAGKAADEPAEKSKEEKKKETPEDVKRKVDEIRKKHAA